MAKSRTKKIRNLKSEQGDLLVDPKASSVPFSLKSYHSVSQNKTHRKQTM